MSTEPTNLPLFEAHIARVNNHADEVLACLRREHEARMELLQEEHERRMREQFLPFDEAYFFGVLTSYSKQATTGCGLVYEIYSKRFSDMVDGYCESLSESVATAFTRFASERFGYFDQSQRRCADPEDGYCSHGIELGRCPAGCDDLKEAAEY